jgi:hypothetical protein
MRLHATNELFNEPSYLNGLDYVALLNGKVQKFCIEADDKKGYVINYKTKNDLVIKNKHDILVKEILFGKVSFKKVENVKSEDF